MAVADLRIIPLPVEGEIPEGADLARLVLDAVQARGEELFTEDVLIVTQKAVSKAEGRVVRLEDVEPSPFAVAYAAEHNKDARHVEVVLRESRRIVKMDRGVLITETHHGFICANAGVDASNVDGGTALSLLPIDSDRSAEELRERLREIDRVAPAVIVTDTFGRVWRNGITNVAIGVAGMAPLHSYAGQTDPHGYELRVTVIAVADEIAAAAELVMRKTDGVPFAIVRGFEYDPAPGSARELVRDAALDLFR
ncbi:MAG: coenzyme F420-0:L-glutamate ligase / coenzyme F420:gamma-L-glutamate ligase [Chloroflexota bacterium]|jgi:coenzyme F420-0:L-glutamate ligase/coenzyme F420-1:gamma-L-glutamate ligase|nr:coenzyme F420-0:L-glutamate ligase / coenzyme F420:gamma-L-glutamate ligase [Chloroflexota bacterium]